MSLPSPPPPPLPRPHRSTLAQHQDVKELLPGFVGRLPRYVRDLRQQFSAGNVVALQKSSHQLRGAGKTYGFAPLSEHAAALEEALLAGKALPELAGVVDTLIAYLENIEGYRGS